MPNYGYLIPRPSPSTFTPHHLRTSKPSTLIPNPSPFIHHPYPLIPLHSPIALILHSYSLILYLRSNLSSLIPNPKPITPYFLPLTLPPSFLTFHPSSFQKVISAFLSTSIARFLSKYSTIFAKFLLGISRNSK